MLVLEKFEPDLGQALTVMQGAQILFELVEVAGNVPDSAQYGVAKNLFQTPAFWLACVLTALVGFGHRFVERGFVWLFRPQARLVS